MKQVRRVLVVEDDRDTRTMVEEVLVGGGFDVDTAGDSTMALRKIGATRYDMAIVDLMLPDLDGVLLHHKIARVDPLLARRLVFTTGFTDRPAVIEFLRRTARAFLAKPFRPDELLAAVATVLSPDAVEASRPAATSSGKA
jgi:DNA-binding response OmpR family regulator